MRYWSIYRCPLCGLAYYVEKQDSDQSVPRCDQHDSTPFCELVTKMVTNP